MLPTETTPVQQIPGQQVTTEPGPTDGIDWAARYKGTGPVINKLTEDNKVLLAQTTQLTSQLEQLKAQLALKDTEKNAAVGERDRQLNDILQAKSQAEAELTRLQALELKFKVAKKLGRADLIEIADTIPSVTDEVALEALMTSIAGWGDKLVKQRENQIMAGSTPTVGATPAASSTTPSSTEAWQAHINSLPLGSTERENAMASWWTWEAAVKK
jgi:hypothetical protein